MKDEIGRSVGLPRALGGIPLDEIGATGFGLCSAAKALQTMGLIKLEGARVAVQGFGAVGRHAARFLEQQGCTLVAACDSRGCIHDPTGLDIPTLCKVKDEDRPLTDVEAVNADERDAIIDIECDIWIPAARPDVIDMSNVDRLNTRLVLQGANIPITRDAEQHLFERGILNVPDFIANAGGVICAAIEYQGGSDSQALAVIDEKITRNTTEVMQASINRSMSPRMTARDMAAARVRDAMSYRRRF
jgi:glutamate dehydrogenase (NAD(P)+)